MSLQDKARAMRDDAAMVSERVHGGCEDGGWQGVRMVRGGDRMSRTVDITLDEDELYRVYMSLHHRIAALKKPGTPKVFGDATKRYEAVFDKVIAAYSAFYSGPATGTPKLKETLANDSVEVQ